MQRPTLRTAKVVAKEWISSKVLEIVFTNDEPMKFIPGQFISLNVAEFKYRAYSLCSAGDDEKKFTLIADAAHEGLGSNYLRNSNIGDAVTFIGPSGKFQLVEPIPSNLVFLATGTGLAPFISMFYELKDMETDVNIHLYFGVRKEENIFYIDKLEEFKKTMRNFDYTLCLSQPTSLWEGNVGRINDYIRLLDIKNTHVYLCGNPFMIDDNLKKLYELGMNESNVFYEKFTEAVKVKS